MSADLTARQAEALVVVRRFLREEGLPPTLRELMAPLGVTSLRGVTVLLQPLEAKGYLVRDYCRARGLRLTDKGKQRPKMEVLEDLRLALERSDKDATVEQCVELYLLNQELEYELVGKREAVHVQKALVRMHSKRAERFEKLCRRLEGQVSRRVGGES